MIDQSTAVSDNYSNSDSDERAGPGAPAHAELRVVVIGGGNSGLGAEIIKKLATAGVVVVSPARGIEPIETAGEMAKFELAIRAIEERDPLHYRKDFRTGKPLRY